MADSKQGKGQKKAKKKSQKKQSTEAKRYQLEQKAAIEEERRRLREELVQIFLQHKLQREQGLGRANQAKINEKWRKILRDVKNEELKEEIEVLREKYEFQIANRQARISELINELATADKNQYEFAQSHIKNLGALIECHQKTIAQLRSNFDGSCSNRLLVFSVEQEKISNAHQASRHEIEDQITKASRAFDELQLNLSKDLEERRNELLDECLEKEYTLTVDLETEIEKTWRDIQEVLLKYHTDHSAEIEIYETLEPKDQVLRKEINHQNEKIQQLLVEVSKLKESIDVAKQGSPAASVLRSQKEELKEALLNERSQGKTRQDEWKKAFLCLVKMAGETSKELDDIIKRGELLLRTVRYEFPTPLVPSPGTYDDPDICEAVDEVMKLIGFNKKIERGRLEDLGPFWDEFNRLLIEKIALKEEFKRLEAENNLLKHEIARDLLAETLKSNACNLQERHKKVLYSTRLSSTRAFSTTSSLKSKINVVLGRGRSIGSNFGTSFESEVALSGFSRSNTEK